MANVDMHAPGNFCWVELATSDRGAAKRFYRGLFGWDSQDTPMGPGETYTLFQLGGRAVGGGFDLSHVKQPGVRPHWMVYVAVADADAAARKAKALGGTELVAPIEVPGQGRMAVLQDPTMVVFSVWQAKPMPGIGANGVGTLCWADCMTPDPKRAAEFYRGLFGWELTTAANDPSGYLHIKNGSEYIGGVPPVAKGAPPAWLAWFQVADCDASAAKATAAGGKVWKGPETMERVGRYAVLSDPQGAALGIITPAWGT